MGQDVALSNPGEIVPQNQALATTDRVIFQNGEVEQGWEAVPRGFLREERETHYQIGRLWRALIIAAAVLALLNSGRLVTMVSGLSVGPVEDTIIVMSETWHEQMNERGLAQFAEDVRAKIDAWRAATWDDVEEELPAGEREGALLRGAQGGV